MSIWPPLRTKFLKRLYLPLAIVLAVAATAYSILLAFKDNMTFFYTPTQLLRGEAPTERSLRIGGMVKSGTLQAIPGTLNIHFIVTDQQQEVPVTYSGVVPDLFKEGKGVVAEGLWQNGVFVANEILAKHDENYMPPKLKHTDDRQASQGQSAP